MEHMSVGEFAKWVSGVWCEAMPSTSGREDQPSAYGSGALSVSCERVALSRKKARDNVNYKPVGREAK